MELAMMMWLVWWVTWITWSHCCCWNYTIAINIRRQLHKLCHQHLALSFYWVKIYWTSFTNGVKPRRGNNLIEMQNKQKPFNFLPSSEQILRCSSIGAIEIIWTISHTFSSSAVASAWVIFASIVEDSDIQFECKISNGCGKAARYFIESIVCCFNAKCQFTRFILLFNVTTSARGRWNQVSDDLSIKFHV